MGFDFLNSTSNRKPLALLRKWGQEDLEGVKVFIHDVDYFLQNAEQKVNLTEFDAASWFFEIENLPGLSFSSDYGEISTKN